MSMSTSANNLNGEDPAPPWMKAVDEKMLYDTGRSDTAEEETSAKVQDSPPPENPSAGSPSPDGSSRLRQELALSMADPSDIPAPNPDLLPTPAGHVRADLNRQLEKAVSVLASRYATDFSRSLVLEFALQRTLLALRKHGEESEFVKWLDSVLPRH